MSEADTTPIREQIISGNCTDTDTGVIDTTPSRNGYTRGQFEYIRENASPKQLIRRESDTLYV